MAFGRLLDLGPEKFQAIIKQLLQGVSALSIARTIQQEWAECRDYPESKLEKLLRRLYDAPLRGAFRENVQKARETINGQTGNAGLECLRDMSEIAHLQRANILRLDQQGCAVPTPILRGYVETLARTLQMQFDIGVVEYRRGQPIAALHEQKVNNAVYEGLDVLNEILSKRGIKEVPPEEAKGDAF